MNEVRYDRQIRLWGDDGQSAIGETSVCMLGSSATATEILKSLVLAGVNSFCIIDDALITESDLDNNFFVEESDSGSSRAAAALRLLEELNPSVHGCVLQRSPSCLEPPHLSHLVSFSVVVAANLSESHAAPISAYLFEKGVPFIHARVYGLLGYLRICVKEHTIINTHQENPPPDLRLDKPFPSLATLIDSYDLEALTEEQLHHTPYLVLYALALKSYREAENDSSAFPSTYAERKSFLLHVNQLAPEKEAGGTDENFEQAKTVMARSLKRTVIPHAVAAVLADEKCDAIKILATTPFWIICCALRRFVDRHKALPLSGQLPDMASDSASYTRLAKIYHEKAMSDAEEVYEDVLKIQESLNHSKRTRTRKNSRYNHPTENDMCGGDIVTRECFEKKRHNISRDTVHRLCKNAAFIEIQRGSSLASQQGDNFFRTVEQLVKSDEAEGCSPSTWLLLLRAADRFKDQKGRYPLGDQELDVLDLRSCLASIISESIGNKESKEEGASMASEALGKVSERTIKEMCRYSASELHVLASIIGGISAQEVIKLATKQYIPIQNTLIYEGHSQSTQTFRL